MKSYKAKILPLDNLKLKHDVLNKQKIEQIVRKYNNKVNKNKIIINYDHDDYGNRTRTSFGQATTIKKENDGYYVYFETTKDNPEEYLIVATIAKTDDKFRIALLKSIHNNFTKDKKSNILCIE